MNEITQYRPNYFSGFENETVSFSSTEELLEIPFIQNFKHGKFSSFSKSDNRLMAEYDDGYEWWVVGMIKSPELVDLPEWKAKYRPTEQDT